MHKTEIIWMTKDIAAIGSITVKLFRMILKATVPREVCYMSLMLVRSCLGPLCRCNERLALFAFAELWFISCKY